MIVQTGVLRVASAVQFSTVRWLGNATIKYHECNVGLFSRITLTTGLSNTSSKSRTPDPLDPGIDHIYPVMRANSSRSRARWSSRRAASD